jgi:hypothetical protein
LEERRSITALLAASDAARAEHYLRAANTIRVRAQNLGKGSTCGIDGTATQKRLAAEITAVFTATIR